MVLYFTLSVRVFLFCWTNNYHLNQNRHPLQKQTPESASDNLQSQLSRFVVHKDRLHQFTTIQHNFQLLLMNNVNEEGSWRTNKRSASLFRALIFFVFEKVKVDRISTTALLSFDPRQLLCHRRAVLFNNYEIIDLIKWFPVDWCLVKILIDDTACETAVERWMAHYIWEVRELQVAYL